MRRVMLTEKKFKSMKSKLNSGAQPDDKYEVLGAKVNKKKEVVGYMLSPFRPGAANFEVTVKDIQ